METLHLTNSHFKSDSPINKLIMLLVVLITLFLVLIAPGWKQAMLSVVLMAIIVGFSIVMIKKSQVSFTLTSSHFQQHLFKGGWVVRWQDIDSIGICTYEQEGWHQPLPWIGIRLKHYSPYLNAICPRIATEILLGQRALLYLGARQNNCETKFEDMVLDPAPYINQKGIHYDGLLAMLANRMKYQRQFYGYDVFISASDLDREAEEFVGLARRYLAAAEPDV
ncbi:hypothetical protein ACOMICROBIO_LMKGKHOH_02088 [Vibrio sp. B1FIG11]|uniref:DUF2982 domain-containing protein n=1 Tax=Vibrio sp. B1FIG11 TaxID=2751177 RepID=UPI001AF4F2E5|nr:DUF2982 domain-containing protein [Vibrio sp. B1FIG11]CAD7806124.1 hypothetical protein ACOMICROBIO_LMKGKHOH_02088 [Vibrio sp. B1FIG11]CAE6901126.1 hypothetical protein ACOMICROBIO_LMKGKHOH_02088 [Vibrio sp. B1FIG11]